MHRTLLLAVGALLVGCSFTADFDGYTFGGTPDAGVDALVDAGRDAGRGDAGPGDVAAPDVRVDESPPTVVSSIPAEGANVLDGRMVVSVRFDEAITIAGTPSDVEVELDGTVAVPGDVEVIGDTLRFTPTSLLANGDYTVSIAPTLTDLSGNALSEAYVLSFTANEGAELTAFREEAVFGSIRCPELAQDDAGNVALTFMEDSSLYFALYRAGEGWSEATELSSNARDAHMAISAGGRVAVAYTATISGVLRPVVRVATGLLSTEFEMPSLADEGLDIDSLDAPSPGSCSLRHRSMGVAVNDAGVVAVMWRTRGSVMSEQFGWARNVRAVDGTWGGEAGVTSISPFDSGSRFRPGIVMDSMGRVETVHYGSNGSADPAYIIQKFDGSEWTRRPFQLGGTALAPIAVRRRDDSFAFVMSGFDGPGGGLSTMVEAEVGSGGSLNTRVIVDRATPDHVAYSTGADSWVVLWREGGRTAFGFRRSDVWRNGGVATGPAIPESARNHVLVSFPRFAFDARRARALLLYEDGDAIRWTELADTPAGVDSLSTGLLFSGGGETVREPRIVFDEESNHGVIAFVGLDGGIVRVANFRGMLTGELTL